MENGSGRVKYRYPLCGMTEFDLSELFFINFDTHISDRRILQSIDNEIWKMCDEKIKALKEINEECEKNGFPECTYVSEDDIKYVESTMLVYSPSVVERAIKRIQEKKFQSLPKNEQIKIARLSLIEFDKDRMNRCPGRYYPICKENYGNPNARKRVEIDDLEKRHNEILKELEKEAIKEFERIENEIQKTPIENIRKDATDDAVRKQDTGNVKTEWFSVFDFIK